MITHDTDDMYQLPESGDSEIETWSVTYYTFKDVGNYLRVQTPK